MTKMWNSKIQRKIAVIVICLFVFSSIFGDAAFAERKSRKSRRERKKKKKYVKSKYGLKALIEVSKTRGKMIKDYKKETDHYNNVKKAIERGKLEKGETDILLKKRLGEPVIILAEGEQGAEKWVYKPGNVSFFDGPKIYLLFDKNGTLTEWEESEATAPIREN